MATDDIDTNYFELMDPLKGSALDSEIAPDDDSSLNNNQDVSEDEVEYNTEDNSEFRKLCKALPINWKASYSCVAWAKDATFPWWPSIVLDPLQVPQNIKDVMVSSNHIGKRHVVSYYGTGDYGFIKPDCLQDFSTFREAHAKQKLAKRYEKDFKKALKEADSSVMKSNAPMISSAPSEVTKPKEIESAQNIEEEEEVKISTKGRKKQKKIEESENENESVSSELEEASSEDNEDKPIIKKRGRPKGSTKVVKLPTSSRKRRKKEIQDESIVESIENLTGDSLSELIRALTKHTSNEELNVPAAIEVIEKLKTLQPSVDEILSSNAVIVNDLRRHQNLEIASAAKVCRNMWKKSVEERETKSAPEMRSREPVIKKSSHVIRGEVKKFAPISGSVPVRSVPTSSTVRESPKTNNEPSNSAQLIDLVPTIKPVEDKEEFCLENLPEIVRESTARSRAVRLIHSTLSKKLEASIFLENALFEYAGNCQSPIYYQNVTKITFALQKPSLRKLREQLSVPREFSNYSRLFTSSIVNLARF